MTKTTRLKKTATRDAVAERALGARKQPARGKGASKAENAPAGQKSGLLPEGDVRLTANINAELHMKLKMRSVQERTTIGELIEEWVKSWG